jgi:Mycothiol maleylpyruvate isomerase N-terminal domain
VETVEIPREVARLRRRFADRIESLDETAWNSASWCTGWRVRDVLAHLVSGAEATPCT